MILTLHELIRECTELRREGRRIVFTNGCFDIVHAGHVLYLQAARQLGDRLVIGLNSDASVQRLKGPTRPLVPESDRAAVLDALRCVDYVTVFDEDTPYELISAIQPDVLVKGGDYDAAATDGAQMIVGADIVRARGGEIRTIPLLSGRSTTDIVARVLRAYGNGNDLKG